MTCPRITRYTGAVKQELQGDEINFSAFAGAPADGPVPRALLPSGAVAEGDRPGARRLGGDGLASAQARLRRRPRPGRAGPAARRGAGGGDRKSTRLNSSHLVISYAVFCLN